MPQAETAGPDAEYPTRPPAAMEPQERLWRCHMAREEWGMPGGDTEREQGGVNDWASDKGDRILEGGR